MNLRHTEILLHMRLKQEDWDRGRLHSEILSYIRGRREDRTDPHHSGVQSWTGNVITKPSDSTGSWSGQEAVISVALLLRTWMAEPLWKAYPWPSVEAAAHKHKTPKSSITGWVIFPRSSENSCEGGPATHTNRYGKAVYRRTTLGTIPTPKAQQEQTVM